ncbi:MAG TPA: SHOCT domain-containing protein [Phycisphaerae bacterium]|jgi:hypothetical protein|nr:SHOCT domain-containing protein [Phycisphaerae bacterium]
MVRSIAPALFLAASACFFPGCIAVGGNEHSHPPTQGQQLIDLKTALDRGAITPAEYDQKKAQILASH